MQDINHNGKIEERTEEMKPYYAVQWTWENGKVWEDYVTNLTRHKATKMKSECDETFFPHKHRIIKRTDEVVKKARKK